MKKKVRLEKDIEKDCRGIALEFGWISRKMNGLGYRSWPDRLFIPPIKKFRHDHRNTFWVEFKRPGEVATPDQERMIKDLRKRGEKVYICDNVVDFKMILKDENHV